MSNLIVTVISIALVAVAALMGAYYGGSAFMDGQAKSKAVSMQNSFEQVAAAMTMYQAENGQNPFNLMDGYPYGAALDSGSQNVDLLVPKYLSAFPQTSIDGYGPSFNIVPKSGNSIWIMNSFGDVTGSEQVRKVCLEIAKIARGPSAEPIVMSNYDDFSIFQKFDCGWFDDGGLWMDIAYRQS